jgi:hypothetical protein
MNPRIMAFLGAALLLVSCSKSPKPEPLPPVKPGGPAITIGGKTIPVEVWAMERERRSTLYGVPRLEEGRGLLLAWPRERYIKVESKSCPATLDVAFLDRSGKIVDAAELKQEDEEGIMSRVEAAYALLVPKKTFELKVGDAGSIIGTIAAKELPVMRIGGVVAHVELALTEADRMHGLMFRPRMSADDGMLFAYPDEDDHSFWMKNTLIPLDIAFFKADGTLLNVNETPMVADPRRGPWPGSPSAGPARYVLEMNLGWFRKHGLIDAAGKVKPDTKAEIPPEAVKGRFD